MIYHYPAPSKISSFLRLLFIFDSMLLIFTNSTFILCCKIISYIMPLRRSSRGMPALSLFMQNLNTCRWPRSTTSNMLILFYTSKIIEHPLLSLLLLPFINLKITRSNKVWLSMYAKLISIAILIMGGI